MALMMQTVRDQLQNLIKQRDNHSLLFQQCVGAVSVLSEQIRLLELENESNKCEGENINGEIDQQISEQITEE